MRARLIYNPTSGHESLPNSVGDILNVMEQAGYEASAYRTTAAKKSALKEARRVAQEGFDLVVAAGGDGTINEVVNGIADLEERPELAIIPAGTTNDYARALKIPRDDVVEAAKVILKKQKLDIDVGQAGDNYFINIAGGGSMTELTYEVPSAYKSILGYLAYLVKGAEMLPRISPIDMHIEYDEGIFDGKATMFLIGLTNSIGGMEQIAPNSVIGDGTFSLIIVKETNLRDLVHLIALVLNGGRHVNNPKIIYTKTKEITVKANDDNRIMINLDGEYGGDAPMKFTNLHNHLRIYANVDSIPLKALDTPTSEEKDVGEKIIEEEKKLD
ncbi:diacylglycerol kinase [Companilactobacillus mishanensis]|uniref:Diacylglycerol kinase n=1 Tax=Companilactobacillus mishanensis TaxID=2486008 RepID=A0A5P0ZKC0_9LACO|nr:diacylglycerol kinase [Companilactobacillus mishanensis]MQS45685.1 diacylglycerol kinase [Companilactobacillus mishanensis]MQS53529.1 diacylglycerol kinase [Companilactobacillus mishanensis]MQS89111.1 diacylglycerol kinase [Companilactobacillus mishanensis]